MKISTKGRYAIRVMIDLAEHNSGDFITLMDIAERQEISEKYLEAIVSILSKNELLISLRGKGGGYKLAKAPEEYTVGSILELTEGSLAPVACLDKQPNSCERASKCKTLEMWEGLNELIHNYFENITIADLLGEENYSDHYVI
ncbi:RrF2 family transcriptional regulator [Konateibacter massiliensis]|uniref:RrF2 family transcriptional regulator n=1 Tax=Konateibacter massiliensis TaxID=2002841 RepID=UPI000C144D66|nr:Rrf2 family transcriptional regulator [Konateibacter massiliensis]